MQQRLHGQAILVNTFTISAGTENGAAANGIAIKFTTGATEGAAWSGNELTITLIKQRLTTQPRTFKA